MSLRTFVALIAAFKCALSRITMLPHQQYAGVVRSASKRCSAGCSGFIKLQGRVDRGLIIVRNLSSAFASNTKAAIAWVTVLRHQI